MKYSLGKIILNDWPALAASLGLPIIWAIHFLFPLLKNTTHALSVWFPVTGSVCLLLVLAWRIRRVTWLFTSGVETRGGVINLSIVKDRGRLEFSFTHAGSTIHSWMPVHKTRMVLALKPGAEIDVLYDRNRPAYAIVKTLFSK